VALSINTHDFARLDDALDDLPGETPALATDPDSTTLKNTRDLAQLRDEIHRGQMQLILVITGKDKLLLGIIDLKTPLIIIIWNLGLDRRWLRKINLLGVLVLRILEVRKEGMLTHLTRHLLAPPELRVGDSGIQNEILEILVLLQELIGGRLSVLLIREVERHTPLSIGFAIFTDEILDTPGHHHRGGNVKGTVGLLTD